MEHNLTCEKGEPSHYKLITRIINRQLHSLILSTRRLAASYDKKLHIQFTSLLRSCKVYGTFVIFTIQQICAFSWQMVQIF